MLWKSDRVNCFQRGLVPSFELSKLLRFQKLELMKLCYTVIAGRKEFRSSAIKSVYGNPAAYGIGVAIQTGWGPGKLMVIWRGPLEEAREIEAFRDSVESERDLQL